MAFKGFQFRVFLELPGISLNLCICINILFWLWIWSVYWPLWGAITFTMWPLWRAITFIFSCVLYFNLMPPSSWNTGIIEQLKPIYSLHATHDFVDFYNISSKLFFFKDELYDKLFILIYGSHLELHILLL